MKTNGELAEEIANEYVGSKYLPDSVDNKLHRLVIKQACMKMANAIIGKSLQFFNSIEIDGYIEDIQITEFSEKYLEYMNDDYQ